MKIKTTILALGIVSVAAFAFANGGTTTADSASPIADEATTAVSTNDVAAAESEQTTEAKKDDSASFKAKYLERWVKYIKQGGNTMIFLGILSILGLGCAIERACTLRRSKIVPDGMSHTVINLWKQNKFAQIQDCCAASKSALARVVETMLEHKEAIDYQQVKVFAEDKAGRELRLENRKSSMLATVATIAPLLGLFGTVVGLLGAFQTVAAVGEMGDPSILADDIGKALVTTVAGLAISMPCLFIYNFIKNKLNLYAVFLEEEVNDIINHIFVQRTENK